MHKYTNDLIHSTSPYLLQHAHNPVNWKEWGPEALEQAKKEDKPILVSIGYSSCHWCHVMEKESFEDPDVANLMNTYFINIKVDREERPDIDQVYMDAVHAMGLQGGWPLNVFLTPDQKPFYGGTYFPKKGWINLLESIHQAYTNKREQIDASAEAFAQSLQASEAEKYKLEGTDHRLTNEEMDRTFELLAAKFDSVDGGIKKSPKFPMPSVWEYLGLYYYRTQNKAALDHLIFTLEKIANGGIYDHIGGGFARYSTDEQWHVPHFEKMLYDNGQLLSLFANGYKLTKSRKFKNILLETIGWMKREMLDSSGGFYSALDADSEGEEGKFYVWSYEEIAELAGADASWIMAYYDVSRQGNWEGKNVLRVVADEADLIAKLEIDEARFWEKISAFKQAALTKREERIRPGLDYKIIAGWNGLALSGLCHAYQTLEDPSILELATQNAVFMRENLVENGKLKRFPNKEMEGFLEDYAAVIQAFITYYETTGNRAFIELAETLTKRANEVFWDQKEGLYFFTANNNEPLIARKKELFDNVIPSSNSIMAGNLIHLGTHRYDPFFSERGKAMVAKTKNLILSEPEYMSNWGKVALELSGPFAEIIIVGPDAPSFAREINQKYLPAKILALSEELTEAPPFKHKSLMDGKTTLYVCYDKNCKRPTLNVEKALSQIQAQ